MHWRSYKLNWNGGRGGGILKGRPGGDYGKLKLYAPGRENMYEVKHITLSSEQLGQLVIGTKKIRAGVSNLGAVGCFLRGNGAV